MGNDLENFLQSHLEKSCQRSMYVDENLKHLAITLRDGFLLLYEICLAWSNLIKWLEHNSSKCLPKDSLGERLAAAGKVWTGRQCICIRLPATEGSACLTLDRVFTGTSVWSCSCLGSTQLWAVEITALFCADNKGLLLLYSYRTQVEDVMSYYLFDQKQLSWRKQEFAA